MDIYNHIFYEIDKEFTSEINIELLQLYHKHNTIFKKVIHDIIQDMNYKFNTYKSQKIITFIMTNKLTDITPLLITNIFIHKNNYKVISKYYENKDIAFYKKQDDTDLVMRLFDTYDIPINDENIYLYNYNTKLFAKFYIYMDKSPEYTKLVKNFGNYSKLIYNKITNPLLKLLFFHNCDFKYIISNTVYKTNIITNIIHTNTSIIHKWKKCYTQYISDVISHDLNFLDALYFYTSDGSLIMHSLLRDMYIPELTYIPKIQLLQRINYINKGIYDAYQYSLKHCTYLTDNLVLYRGINNINVVLTKGSIINNCKNQFISFSSKLSVAQGFGNIILMLEINKDDKYKTILPIENIKHNKQYISQNSHEHEWLLPLNTSLIITDVLHYKLDDDINIILNVKIYHQEFIENIDDKTFKPEIIKNVFANKIKFIDNLVPSSIQDIKSDETIRINQEYLQNSDQVENVINKINKYIIQNAAKNDDLRYYMYRKDNILYATPQLPFKEFGLYENIMPYMTDVLSNGAYATTYYTLLKNIIIRISNSKEPEIGNNIVTINSINTIDIINASIIPTIINIILSTQLQNTTLLEYSKYFMISLGVSYNNDLQKYMSLNKYIDGHQLSINPYYDEPQYTNMIYSMLFRLICALRYLNTNYEFVHGDINADNIMIANELNDNIEIDDNISGIKYKINTFNKKFILIDFGFSRIKYNEKIYNNVTIKNRYYSHEPFIPNLPQIDTCAISKIIQAHDPSLTVECIFTATNTTNPHMSTLTYTQLFDIIYEKCLENNIIEIINIMS